MTTTPTDYAPCTIEDGSDAAQVFPCHWDASTQGNGQGDSFVLLEAGGVPYYDIDTAEENDSYAPPPVTTTEVPSPPAPTPEVITEVGTVAPSPTLAATGVDPTIGIALAVGAILAGIALTRRARRG